MAEKDGATCSTCFTLNPPGAPACIRCNSPLGGPGLAPEPQPAAPVAVPAEEAPRRGLAVPPRGTPGASREAAATEQPPGYGLGGPTGPAPADQQWSPAEQRRIGRRIAIVGGLVVLLVLAAGGAALYFTRAHYLDVDAVADQIEAQLGQSARVRCPDQAESKAGVQFRCVASDAKGKRYQVEVVVLDSDGGYRWSVSGPP